MNLNNLNKDTDTMALTSIVSTEKLNYNQKQKFAVLRKIYPDDATTVALVRHIDGKGENSYKNVIDKITAIERSDRPTSLYHDSLYDNFVLDQTYTFDQIIGDVSAIRMDHNLTPYTSRFKKNCEYDFVSLFIVKPEYENTTVVDEGSGEVKTKKTHIGYTPLFKLKPED